MESHYITEVIKYCQESGQLKDDEILQVEWLYVVAFSHRDFEPVYLQKAVVSNPKVFSLLTSFIFKRSEGVDEPEEISDQARENRAKAAWYALKGINILPGANGGSIDSQQLREWVDQARAFLLDMGRADIGDGQIGTYLSNSPVGEDGVWPHEAVRNVIESIQSENFDNNFLIGRLNSRGVTVRHPYAGGAQEKEISAEYRSDAEKIQFLYPRTAKILRSLADSYSIRADREDEFVEIHH